MYIYFNKDFGKKSKLKLKHWLLKREKIISAENDWVKNIFKSNPTDI